MQKKGQITLFVIIGIVIVALVVLLVALRNQIYVPATASNLQSEMNKIKVHINSCLKKEAQESFEKIGLQGGYLDPPEGSYHLWNDARVSYLCYNQVGKEICSNRLLTVGSMETQLEDDLRDKLASCLDLSDFEGGLIKTYTIIAPDSYDVAVNILRETSTVKLNFPVTLQARNSDEKVSVQEFAIVLDVPLGDFYDVSQDILDAETELGRFDTLSYMLSKLSRYTIELQKPYPDKMYVVRYSQLHGGDYKFQFAVEGEPS